MNGINIFNEIAFESKHSDNILSLARKALFSKAFYLILIFIGLIFNSCNKNEDSDPAKQIPVITTLDVSQITRSSAVSGGTITSDGGSIVTIRGVCWSTNETPTIADSTTKNGAGAGSFTSTISNLIPETTYFIRAYATNKNGTGYGMTMSFKTAKPILASVTTSSASDITHASAISGGTIKDDGGSGITMRGICWNTEPQPTIQNFKTENGSGSGSFSATLTDLQPNVTYYIRAYATNLIGTSYGNQISIKTISGSITFNPLLIAGITVNSALVKANITSDGGVPVTQKGFCWSINQNPNINDNILYAGQGLGEYTSTIPDLNLNTTYFIKAFGVNGSGVHYSEALTFKTLDGVSTLTAYAPTNITANSVSIEAVVSSDGGGSLSSRGFCWSREPNPTIADNSIVVGNGIGPFGSSINNLDYNSTYFIRAFATNKYGTFYSNENTFETLNGIPLISTLEVSNILATSAKVESVIDNDGGLPVLTRGFVWDTQLNPDINDNFIEVGNGIGTFNTTLASLQIGTKYYVKSYVINEKGIFYSNIQRSFTTINYPNVTSNSIQGIVQTSVIATGTVTNDGNAPLTTRGFAWATNLNPTIANNTITVGNGIGQYSKALINLLPNTTYHLRAWAQNLAGIVYGDNLTFTTEPENITVTDYDGNIYNTITVGNQIWMAENLKTTTYDNGTPIPQVNNPFDWAALTSGAYVWYNTEIEWKEPYGGLYNWHAITNVNVLCPQNWSVPTVQDFQTLSEFLGGNAVSGGKLKSTRTDPETHPRWNTPNAASTNSSNWSAFGGGIRHTSGNFAIFGLYGRWWSTTETDLQKSNAIELTTGNGTFTVTNSFKYHGYSVRCIKTN